MTLISHRKLHKQKTVGMRSYRWT